VTLGDDYRGEMTRFARLSDEEIERLLDGSSTTSEVADVASFFAEFRKGVTRQVDEATIAHYVHGAAAVAAAGADSINAGSLEQSFLTPGNVATPPERNTAVKMPFSKRRTVVAALTALTLLGSTTGIAVAANGAKPGDGLYGIDRALEAVGVGDGGGSERAGEIQALFEAGDLPRSLTHAAEVIPEVAGDAGAEATQGASEALAAAADTVEASGGEVSEGTRLAVAALLDYLSENVGKVDGMVVADMARGIAGRPDPETVPKGPPVDVPAGPPGDAPVRPVDVPASPTAPPEERPTPPGTLPGPPVTPANRP
jgi:hypothetical protein